MSLPRYTKLDYFLGLSARKFQDRTIKTREDSFHNDPTWNNLAKALLFYTFPLVAVATCISVGTIKTPGFLGAALFFCAIEGGNWIQRPRSCWVYKDFMYRDFFPFLPIVGFASLWTLSESFFGNPVPFLAGILAFEFIASFYRLIIVQAAQLSLHRSVFFAPAMLFRGTVWIYACVVLSISPSPILSFFAAIPVVAALYLYVKQQETAPDFSGIKNVAVIGAGWAGLYATKWLKEAGLQVETFEKADHVGGVWSIQNAAAGKVIETTRATASKHYLQATDFIFDHEAKQFPTHREVIKFLNDYTDHFSIRNNIRFSCQVRELKKSGDSWGLTFADESSGNEETKYYDAVVISSGPQGVPSFQVSDHPLYSKFTGEIIHSVDYDSPDQIKPSENVLIVGSGETSADIAEEVVQSGANVHWSVHSGQWFADRNIGRHEADFFVGYGFRVFLGLFLNFEILYRRFGVAPAIDMFWGRGGHGVKAWEPSTHYLHQFLNKSRDGLRWIYAQLVMPHKAVVGVEGKNVYFHGEEEPVAFDRIILATGYVPHWPFLANRPTHLFKKTFTDDPTLAFVGFARPIVGSIPSLSEMQARWVSALYAGKTKLPSQGMRDTILAFDMKDNKTRLRDEKNRGLVDQEAYSTQLAEFTG